VNLDITRAVEHAGLYFAPDPSSQKSCTIGGNVAENAGGPHTLAYGVTVNHVTALELVLPDGEIVRVGSKHGDTPGYDLCGLFVGSEGTLALVTEITVKLTAKPKPSRPCWPSSTPLMTLPTPSLNHRARHHSRRLRNGGRLDPLRHRGLHPRRLPRDSAAILHCRSGRLREAVKPRPRLSKTSARTHHAREVRIARDDRERDLLWKGRKNAFGALGRLAPATMSSTASSPFQAPPGPTADSEHRPKSTASPSATSFHAATATSIHRPLRPARSAAI